MNSDTKNQKLQTHAPEMAKTLQRAAHVLAELKEQPPELLTLRAEIVGLIKRATPEHYGIKA